MNTAFVRTAALSVLLLGMLLTSPPAPADDLLPDTSAPDPKAAGRGLRSISVGLEVLSFADSFRGTQRAHGGEARSESLLFGIDYGLNERWSLSASIPLIRKRYRGPAPHVPALLDPPNNTAPFIDDGLYHGGWQDFRFGLHYATRWRAFLISPYVVAHVPSHDYPHFGQAAIGQNRHKLQLGVGIGRVLETYPFYYRFDLSHSFVERTLGRSVDHTIYDLSLGWFATERLALSVFGRKKTGKGVEPTDRAFFGPPPFRNEAWYQHDRLFPHEYELVGASLEWMVDEDYAIGLSFSQMAGGNYVQRIDLASSITLTRFFGH